VDHDKVTEFLGQFVSDLAATDAAGSVVVGHRLGLYRSLAQGSATPEEFAERTGCHPRYLAEWLKGQAAGGYVSYTPATGAFYLTEEQAFCLADPNGPNLPAAFLISVGMLRAEPKITAGPAPASAGTSTATTSSSAAMRSTAPVTSPTSSRTGSPPWTEWTRSSPRAPGWPTSAAGSARRRC
jgi:hypothetical protein